MLGAWSYERQQKFRLVAVAPAWPQDMRRFLAARKLEWNEYCRALFRFEQMFLPINVANSEIPVVNHDICEQTGCCFWTFESFSEDAPLGFYRFFCNEEKRLWQISSRYPNLTWVLCTATLMQTNNSNNGSELVGTPPPPPPAHSVHSARSDRLGADWAVVAWRLVHERLGCSPWVAQQQLQSNLIGYWSKIWPL